MQTYLEIDFDFVNKCDDPIRYDDNKVYHYSRAPWEIECTEK